MFRPDKTIYLLVGPKGSGKSFVGKLIEREFGIRFFRVEDQVREVRRNRTVDDPAYIRDAFETIERMVREQMQELDRLVFESTGLSDHFREMVQRLERDFCLHTIGLDAHPETCRRRVRERDQSIHIPVSDDELVRINQEVRRNPFPVDFRIWNENKTVEEVLEALRDIIS